ncbi:MAG: DUF1848 domain-containing protein [Alphaproteobacteria bacterium]|nr:DUF1848 domain-containing protein [Alphaproteobacteria bacterium]
MIVSASYKTDIPAFYGAWFDARLDAGMARMVNPRWGKGGGQVSEIALTRDTVDGFVFWTRNPTPFAAQFRRVARDWPFVVQFTITGYPRALDRSVPGLKAAVAAFKALAGDWGDRAVVWRYDPIVTSSATPTAWHVANFGDIARTLAGATDEVVVSFAHIYAKTRRNLDRAAATAGFDWDDPTDKEKRELLAELAPIAEAAGMRLTLCAQPDLLVEAVKPAACIEPARLFGKGHGRDYAISRNRPGCLCAVARDIGGYETCPHACVYCYGVGNMERAKANFAAHDPAAAVLGAG